MRGKGAVKGSGPRPLCRRCVRERDALERREERRALLDASMSHNAQSAPDGERMERGEGRERVEKTQ